jgi:hypothetical protein
VPNVLLSEQKLSVQITYLDIVVVSDREFTFLRAQTHQCKHLDELASQCASPNYKRTGLRSHANELVSKDDVVILIAIVRDGSANLSFGQYFKEFVMKPLA